MSDIAVHKILQYIEVHCSSKKNNIDKSSAQMETIVSNPSTKFKMEVLFSLLNFNDIVKGCIKGRV